MPWLLRSRLVAPILLGIGAGFIHFLFTLTLKRSCHPRPPPSTEVSWQGWAEWREGHLLSPWNDLLRRDTIAAPVSHIGGWCYNSGSMLGSTLGSRSRPWTHQRCTERLCLVTVMAKVTTRKCISFFFSLAHRKSGLGGIQPRYFFLWKVLK